jgi:hypothetical protein
MMKRIFGKWVFPLLMILLAQEGCRTIRVEKPAERYDVPEYYPQYSNINIPLEVSME